MRKGTNLPRMGDFNQTVILDVIRHAPQGYSRAQVTRRTGLSAQTVSNICTRLLAEGLIVETGSVEREGPGRRGTLLRLNGSARYAIGIHFDPAVLTAVVLDLTGAVVAKAVLSEPGAAPPEDLIDQVHRTVEELIARADISRDRIVGVGIASPGPIDSERGLVMDPPLLSGWHSVPLRDQIAEATGLPTVLDKDVNAAASAHLWFPATRFSGNFVFVYHGAGIALATTINDEVIRGRSTNAGDVGNWLVDHSGPPSHAGLIGTLGELVSARNIVKEGIDAGALCAGGIDVSSHADVYRGVRQLCQAADDGDRVAEAVLSRASLRTVKAAADLAHVLDIGTIIFGGPVWDVLPKGQLQVVQDYLDAQVGPGGIWSIQAVLSPFGSEVGAIGGGCVLLERAFAPRPADLLLAE